MPYFLLFSCLAHRFVPLKAFLRADINKFVIFFLFVKYLLYLQGP